MNTEVSILTGTEFLNLKKRENKDLRDGCKSWLRPCVYVHLRDDVCLYVGKSKHGWKRIFYGKHRNVQKDDVIEFYWVDEKSLHSAEVYIISELYPIDNKIIGRFKYGQN